MGALSHHVLSVQLSGEVPPKPGLGGVLCVAGFGKSGGSGETTLIPFWVCHFWLADLKAKVLNAAGGLGTFH